ncbi:NADH-quinone oxidoreductase subunit D [bacterium]|nr:MAG: NADH-quinone oxidoreductase subunit D [bacterium]
MEHSVKNVKIVEKGQPLFFKEHQESLYKSLEDKHTTIEFSDDDPLGTRMILNMGPQHPATHGVLRVLLELDGETILKNRLDVGYLHRGVEKIAENKTYQEFMPYTDRMDYLSPYASNVAWCLAVEKLAQITIPERAQYIRMIGSELARISSHLLWLGAMVMDSGAISMFIWTFREREKIYDIFDQLAGHRFTVSHSRIGGVAFDINDSTIKMIRDFSANLKKEIKDWNKLLAKNRIFFDRNNGIGPITTENAIALGLTGAGLRATGIAYDVRKFAPYLKYNEVEFEVPTRLEGDNLARYYVRMEELSQAVRIIDQCLDKLPKGPIRVDDAKKAYPSKDEVYYSMEGLIHDFMMTDTGVCPPEGVSCFHSIEASKGELGYYIESDGTGHPWRVKIKSPSLTNLQVLEHVLDGQMVADTVVLIGGLDPVMGDADK